MQPQCSKNSSQPSGTDYSTGGRCPRAGGWSKVSLASQFLALASRHKPKRQADNECSSIQKSSMQSVAAEPRA